MNENHIHQLLKQASLQHMDQNKFCKYALHSATAMEFKVIRQSASQNAISFKKADKEFYFSISARESEIELKNSNGKNTYYIFNSSANKLSYTFNGRAINTIHESAFIDTLQYWTQNLNNYLECYELFMGRESQIKLESLSQESLEAIILRGRNTEYVLPHYIQRFGFSAPSSLEFLKTLENKFKDNLAGNNILSEYKKGEFLPAPELSESLKIMDTIIFHERLKHEIPQHDYAVKKGNKI